MTRRSPRTTPLGVILLTLFLDLVGFSIVFPMFAELLRTYEELPGGLLAWLNDRLGSLFDLGAKERHVAFFGGVLSGLYATVQFFVTPFWGRLSDRIGRRPVILLTVLLNLLGYLLWVFAGTFEVFVAARVVSALASGNISVASAAVADISDAEGRSRAMGMMGAAIGLGFIMGPALGSAWTLMPHPESVPGATFSLNPFSFPAAIALGLTAINLAWVAVQFHETHDPSHRRTPATTRSANPLRLFSADLGATVLRLNLIYLLFMIGFAGFEATMVFLAAERLKFAPHEVGLVMIWLGLCSVVVQGGVVRRFVRRAGERRLASLGLSLLVPGYLLSAVVGWFSAPWVFILGVTFLALGVGFLSPTLAALVSLASDGESMGRTMGTYRSVGALGRAIGPLSAAILYFRFGPGIAYLAWALLAVAPLLLMLHDSRTRATVAAENR